MNNAGKKKIVNKLPPQLEKFFVSYQYLSRELLDNLKPADILEIKRIAKGEVPYMSKSNRVKALMAMSQLGGEDESKILSEVVANDKEESEIRAIAATNLGLLPAKYAEPKLIQNLDIKDELIQFKLIKSLGCIGGIKALEALDRISYVKSDFVQKQLKFAKTLISYRLGLSREDMPFVRGVEREIKDIKEPIQLTMIHKGSEGVSKTLQLLEGSTYGIDIAVSFGFEINARKAKWMLFLNEKCIENNFLSPIIAKQKMIIGLMARRAEEMGTYSVQYIVLTTPRNRLIDIMVVRTDGEIFYSGHASIYNSEISFSISDVEHPGTAPTSFKGRFKPDKGIEIEACLASGKRINKRQTMELKR